MAHPDQRVRRLLRTHEIIPTDARLPQLYEQACQALQEAAQIDECRHWADRAAALAAYGRQAQDQTIIALGHRIRLRAIRRVGELCLTIPAAPFKSGKGRFAQAKQAGFSRDKTIQALRLARIDRGEFDVQVELEQPPSVTALADPYRSRYRTQAEATRLVQGLAQGYRRPRNRARLSDQYLQARFVRMTLLGLREALLDLGPHRTAGPSVASAPEHAAAGVLSEEWPLIEAHWRDIQHWMQAFLRAPRRREHSNVVKLQPDSK